MRPNALRRFLKRQAFLPNPLGVLNNPSYIVRSRLFEALRDCAPAIGGKVLDFGCGSKPYESLFPRATDYVGLDIAVSGHAHADSRVDVFYDGTTIPFPDAYFDAVVSFEVFEHVFNLPDVLAEIRRVLKPSGRLLVTVPFAWPEHEQPYDFARYTSFGLKAALERSGFDVLRVEKTGDYVLALAQLLVTYVQLSVARWPRVPALAVQFLLLAPMTAVGLGISRLLPRRTEIFCNLVVVAEAQRRDVAERAGTAAGTTACASPPLPC